MKKKLSIVHIIDQLNAGGAERVIVTLANLFVQHGHNVKVICTVKPGILCSELRNDVLKQSLNRKWKYNPAVMYRLIRQVKNYDVIHVHSLHNLRYYKLAATLMFFNKKVFYHEHYGHRLQQKPSVFRQIIFNRIIFIAISNALKHWALQQLMLDKKTVFVLPNTVIKQAVLMNESKEAKPVKLLVTANFLPVKNIQFALKIMQRLQTSCPGDYHLTIVGKPFNQTYYREIREEIKKHQLDKVVTIDVACNNIQPVLNQYDVALHPSVSESGPLVLIEYLCQQLPFITFNTGQVAEQITSFLPVLVEETFIVESWIEKIEQIINSDKHVLKEKMKKVFETHYSAENYYNDCLHIYHSVE